MRSLAAFLFRRNVATVHLNNAEQGDLGAPIMRHIHLDDGLRLRFPGRSEDFDQGVEIGMIAVLMDQEMPEFSRWISRSNLGQVEAIARQMGYRVTEAGGDEDWVDLTFRHGSIKSKPNLRLVHSAG
jgi:hypothetical protein